MEFSVKRGLPQKQKSACLIVAVHGGKHLSAAATALDKPLRGALSRVVQRGDVGAKPGDTLLLPDVHGIEAERVLLVACGRRDGISAGDYAKAVRSAAAALKTHKLRSAVSALLEVEVKGHDLAWKVDQHARAAAAAAYRFDEHKSKPGGAVPSRLGLLASDDDAPAVREALRRARALADGLKLARDHEKPYLFLGRLYKAIGQGGAAEKMFTRAVQIRPDSVEALRELRLINMRKNKKGLIGRILRR